MHIYTDTYEDLSDEELAKLDEYSKTEDDFLEAICRLLNIRIELYNDEQIIGCTICSKEYLESLVNTKDFLEEKICHNCLPKHPFRKDLILLELIFMGKWRVKKNKRLLRRGELYYLSFLYFRGNSNAITALL